jgi:hypothetical protein
MLKNKLVAEKICARKPFRTVRALRNCRQVRDELSGFAVHLAESLRLSGMFWHFSWQGCALPKARHSLANNRALAGKPQAFRKARRQSR